MEIHMNCEESDSHGKNNYFNLKASLMVGAMLLLPIVHAATMTKADKTRISADYRAGKRACAALASNAKDICVEKAKARKRVARAELEDSDSGKAADPLRAAADAARATAF
jgi:hypothetical protein